MLRHWTLEDGEFPQTLRPTTEVELLGDSDVEVVLCHAEKQLRATDDKDSALPASGRGSFAFPATGSALPSSCIACPAACSASDSAAREVYAGSYGPHVVHKDSMPAAPAATATADAATAASGVVGEDYEDCNEPHEEHGRHGHPLEADDDDDDSAGYDNMVEELVTITIHRKFNPPCRRHGRHRRL